MDKQDLDKIISLATILQTKDRERGKKDSEEGITVLEILVREPEPEYTELFNLIYNLSSPDRRELIAIMWIGRGDYSYEDKQIAMSQARPDPAHKATGYILDKSLRLADYLHSYPMSFHDVRRTEDGYNNSEYEDE